MTKLEKVLKYVSENNEFYKKIIDDYNIADPLQIKNFPIITREVFQINKDIMLSPEYRINNLTNNLYKLSSSGTSGIPTETLWDPNQYDRAMLALWRRRKKYYNISPNDKNINFMLKYYNKLPDIKLNFSLTGNTISINRLNMGSPKVLVEFFQLINNFQPSWLQLSPSVMEIIINYCYIKREVLPKSIKYIEFMSEVLTPAMRKQTTDLIPHAQIANMYGSEEMNPIAYECPCGKMHIISENVYAECFDGKNINQRGNGTIILTNLNNTVHPLIRYNQGDQITLEKHTKCACGYTDKIITELLGRKSTTAIINGYRLSTCDVSDIMLIVANKFGHPIKKYKFIYHSSKNTISCYVLFNNYFSGWYHEICNTIKNLFIQKYGSINIEFVLGDYDKNNYKHDLLLVK